MKPLDEINLETDDELISRVWFHILRAHRILHPKFEKELRKYGFDSPVWHEIMVEIERAGSDGIRATELQNGLHLAQFNMSRHLSRMEKKGFVERKPSRQDKRANLIVLTDAGRQANRDIWPKYFDAIKSELGDKLSHDEAFQLFKLLLKFYA